MPKKKESSKVSNAVKEVAIVEDKKPAEESINLSAKKQKKASKVSNCAKEEAVIEDKTSAAETVNLPSKKKKKKKSSKVSTDGKEEEGEELASETVNEIVEKKRARDEIDEIFASKKKTKKLGDQKEGDKKSADGKPKKNAVKKMKIQNSSGSTKENGGDSHRRRTNDGLKIYSASELGFNRQDAGGTKLCPFDCECCF